MKVTVCGGDEQVDVPGMMYCPAITSAPRRLSTASLRNCDMGICAPVTTYIDNDNERRDPR